MLKLTLESERGEPIAMSSTNWRETLQCFLYSCLEVGKSDELQGEEKGSKRKFKLFAYSNLCEEPGYVIKRTNRNIYGSTLSFYVCSVDKTFLNAIQSLCNSSEEPLHLGMNEVRITRAEVYTTPPGSYHVVKALSPICCYNTTALPNGKKRTVYLHPEEPEFQNLLHQNLLQKYKSFYKEELEDSMFSIIPVNTPKEEVSKYKGLIVKAYYGIFEISGSPELLNLAFSAGLGSKGSMGFGLIVPKQKISEQKK